MNYLLALLSGALLVLLFPRFNLPWLATIALTPLLIALSREFRPRRRFLLGYIAGLVFWCGVCYWIQAVLAVHGGMGQLGGAGAFTLFCMAKALHFGLFGMLSGVLISRPYAIPAIAALWAGLERTQQPTNGFAWLTLGNAGIDMGAVTRLAPFTGVYGLSFTFALMSAAVALVILRRPRAQILCVGIVPLLILLPSPPDPVPGNAVAVLVQPNISEYQNWTEQSVEQLKQRLAIRSMEGAVRAGEPSPDLIVWPEMPAPIYYFEDAPLRKQVAELVRTLRAPLLMGTVVHNAKGSPLNSGILVSTAGESVGQYDKIYLVPFGEFIPPLFGWIDKITSEAGDFVPGVRVTTMDTGRHRVGSFICYESAVPHLVRQFAREGAEVYVNISNDGYFFRSAARDQHLLLVRMRAAENRRWILRATNSGITAAVDPAGRVTETWPSFTDLSARARFDYEQSTTPYSRHGDWFAWSCLAGAGVALLASQWPHYRRT